MKKILLLLGALLFSHNVVANEEVAAEDDQAEDETSVDDNGYDMSVAGWGRNDRELLNDYGVILNYVDGFLQEIIDNDALSVFYVFDSS